MKLSLQIRIDDELKNLAQQFPKAGQAVLNRTAREAATLVSKEIPKVYNVKQSDVKKRIAVIGAKAGSLVAILKFSQKGFNPLMFATPKSPTTRRQQVFLEVRKGNKSAIGNKWFIQRGRGSGKLGLFTQQGDKREELTRHGFLKAGEIFNMPSINQLIQRFAENRIATELPRVIKTFYRQGK